MADPYLAVSLDAVNHAADLGRASGLTEEAAGWGLVRMWAHAFRSKVDMVTPAQVSGFFGGDVARVAVALIAFGFLEARGADFRVKGADRYLRLHEARRKGGLAAAKNLVPGARHRKRKSIGSSRDAAEKQPEVQPGLLSALSPSTEHRAPSEKQRIAPAPPSPFVVARNALVSVYHSVRGESYLWQGAKDTEALKRLLGMGATPEEMARRFRILLTNRGYPDGSTVAHLAQRWNDLTAPAQTGQRRPTGADPNQGILTRERMETPEEIEEANRRAEEWVNGG